MKPSESEPVTERSPRSGGVRFAPSPTGRFHIGNLRTGWVSHLIARELGLPWVVRFEDIDRARALEGAQQKQLDDMKELGLSPDLVLTQTDFFARHLELFETAVMKGQVYACDCSRKDVHTALAGIASAPNDGATPVYSGRCRSLGTRDLQAQDSIAWRFRMEQESGHEDFIIARSSPGLDAKGLPDRTTFVPAYHWACAIDDFDGGYDLLVRSIDLKPAVRLQRAIHQWVATTEIAPEKIPALFHTSLVVQDDGVRLEKRTAGVTLSELLAQNFSAEILVEAFKKSFDWSIVIGETERSAVMRSDVTTRLAISGFISSGGITNESRERIRLSELISRD